MKRDEKRSDQEEEGANRQVDSFIPGWEWDEPKKKKLRKIGEKRSKKVRGEKSSEKAPVAPPSAIPSAIGAADPAAAAAEAAAAPAAGNADAESGVASTTQSTGTTTATAPPATTARSRQAATVEEVDDE